MENEEVWETYPEFNFIQDSNFGRVRTIDRYVLHGKGTQFVKGRVLKQQLDKDGYLYVHFRVNGKLVNRKVHRLIAQTFLPNPNNWLQVNHKDNNPANNNVGNLEWCTGEYNIEYREKYGEAQNIPVYAVNLTTQEVSRFRSQSEAERVLVASNGSVNHVLKGQYKQTHGYWFTYADSNAVESTKAKFGDEVANRVAKLMESE